MLEDPSDALSYDTHFISHSFQYYEQLITLSMFLTPALIMRVKRIIEYFQQHVRF